MQVLEEHSRSLGEFLLLPNLTTPDCAQDRVDLTTRVVRHRAGEPSALCLATPIVSAIMQSVSEPRLAIALARRGGLSFLHHNQSIEDQAQMVREVKAHKAGFRAPSATLGQERALCDVLDLLDDSDRAYVAITDDGSPTGQLVGLISRQDFHPARHDLASAVNTRMRPLGALVTVKHGTSLSEANDVLWDHHLDVLPVVDADGRLASLVVRGDYEAHKSFPHETIDHDKRLRVGAGINTHDYRRRLPALVDAGVDVVCIDSSDGYSTWQADTIRHAKTTVPQIPIGAGNVVDHRGFRYLADAGADFVKVGIGGGSICITREQKGIGRGQADALIDVVSERDRYADETGDYIPICCDGGVLLDNHMAIALALGADFIMLGRYFARFDESPGRRVELDGRPAKEYWGEGSRRAQNAARYDQGDRTELDFEEGVDGYVPYAGSVDDGIITTLSKLRSTLVSCGASNLKDFHDGAVLAPISPLTSAQGTHDIQLRRLEDEHR